MTSPSKKIRVAFLTQSDEGGASARLRAYGLVPYLEKEGISAGVFPARGKASTAGYFQTFIQRLLERNSIAQHYDVLILQRDLINHLAPWLEKLYAATGTPIVLDVDDAIDLYPPGRTPGLKWRIFGSSAKLEEVCRLSHTVVAGNAHLAGRIRQWNSRVEVIPTCLDLSAYPPPPRRKLPQDRPAVIGWIGSPLTTPYLEILREPLEKLLHEREIIFRTIGAAPLPWSGIQIEQLPWSAQTAASEVARFDVGVMPLTDDEWSRSKCGTKIIEYFAAGVPVVASPVGMNTWALDEGRAGLLASSTQEWEEKLRLLLTDAALYENLSRKGRKRAEEVFDIHQYAPAWAKILREAAAR